MKTRNLLLALGCAAAFTACTNNDEPAVAPAPAKHVVTLSVDVNEPADTRAAYSEEGSTYKFAWSDGDMIVVFYNDGSDEVYADFTIDTFDGKKATFTSEDFPDDFIGPVTIVYAGGKFYYEDLDGNGMNNDLKLTGYYGQTTNVAADLAARTLLYAEAEVTEPGVLPDVKLNHMFSYLLLKTGLQVTQADLTVGADDTELLFDFWIPSDVSFDSKGYNNSDAASIFGNIEVSDGKLTHDCLVPVFVGTESLTEGLNLSAYLSGYGRQYVTSQPSFTYEPGVIYEVKADKGWLPVEVVVPKVGMVIGADGIFYENATAAEEAGTTAEAMIAYLGTAAEDAPHGLAIALKQASESPVSWDNSAEINGGKTAAEIVDAWANFHEINGDATGWRLPSAYDWQLMFIGCGSPHDYVSELTSIINDFGYGDFITNWNTATESDFNTSVGYDFWTSTEHEEDTIWYVGINTSAVNFRYSTQNGKMNVLACLAF